jgi:hypothetical protein
MMVLSPLLKCSYENVGRRVLVKRRCLGSLFEVLVAVLGIGVAHRDTARPEDGQPPQVHKPSVGSSGSQTKGMGTGYLATKAVTRCADVSSGQVNFGCEETQQVKTPEVFFGANARDIQPRPEWVKSDNAKSQNQQVIYATSAWTDVRVCLPKVRSRASTKRFSIAREADTGTWRST